MGSIGCPETSVRNYYSTLRNIPEQRKSHLHRGGSLKSHIILRSSRQLFRHTAMKEWEPPEESVTKIVQGTLITRVLVNKTLRT